MRSGGHARPRCATTGRGCYGAPAPEITALTAPARLHRPPPPPPSRPAAPTAAAIAAGPARATAAAALIVSVIAAPLRPLAARCGVSIQLIGGAAISGAAIAGRPRRRLIARLRPGILTRLPVGVRPVSVVVFLPRAAVLAIDVAVFAGVHISPVAAANLPAALAALGDR